MTPATATAEAPASPRTSLVVPVLAAVAAVWWLAVYVPGAGVGFLKDDFGWIALSRVDSLSSVVALFSKNSGFYRPIVACSFSVDYLLFGLNALAFGWTNLLLAVLVACSIARLALSLRLAPLAAFAAAALWALNPHGINMAILWTSGRTALLLTLFATLAATSWVKGRAARASCWTLLALLSKEEAVVLPFVLLAWLVIDRVMAQPEDGGHPRRRSWWTAVPLFAALGVYLALRVRSGAFTPGNAPPYYRVSSDLQLLAVNVLSYLDRAATFPVVVAIVATLAARRMPAFDRNTRRVVAMSALWLVAGYALTVWLPVRSSLYACFPSVGAALIAGSVVAGLARSGREVRLVPALVVVSLVAIASTPVYWARNERWVGAARVSSSVLADLPGIVANQPRGTTLFIRDSDNPRANIKAAFGTLLPDAVTLATGRDDLAVWVQPPPGDWELGGWRPPQPGASIVSFTFDGRALRKW